MKLTGWDYPQGEGLGITIDKLGIHPITALTKVNKNQKEQIIQQGVVLCTQLEEKPEVLAKCGVDKQDTDTILKEAKAIAALKNTL
jgi:hypothetical protein